MKNLEIGGRTRIYGGRTRICGVLTRIYGSKTVDPWNLKMAFFALLRSNLFLFYH